MAPKKKTEVTDFSDSLIRTCCKRLALDKGVRRTLPGNGRLHVDRQLPFLCVYRRRPDDPGTESLVRGVAAYLVAPEQARYRKNVSGLVREMVTTMAAEFGAFLIIEVWSGPDGGRSNDPAIPSVPPQFQVLVPTDRSLSETVDVLARGLSEVRVMKQRVTVEIVRDRQPSPPGMCLLLDHQETLERNCSILGLVVPPVYRDPETRQEFPPLLRSFRRALSQALAPTVYRFSRARTTHRPPHYHELGRRAVVKAVWEVDQRLGDVSSEFDFLMLVTPINGEDAWKNFKRSDFKQVPEFHYRPTPFDPAMLKRALYQIPVERVEDPALHHIFQEKQEELERKIAMLRDRDTPRFLYGSLQLYGDIGDGLFKLSTELLDRLPLDTRERSAKTHLDAQSFADRARDELDYYRKEYPEFLANVRVTKDVAGVMVSRDCLLINPTVRIASSRVDALLHHEIGTHLLTYYNGRAQPFQQLSSGLAGYDELQEGLAVLAEFLVGELSSSRLRQLAARVLAARRLVAGASFVEVFRELNHTYGFPHRSAFTITMRTFRGGGLTKDAVYLRGLSQILEYLVGGGKLEPLFVGKFALRHLPIIHELQHRKVLKVAPLCPRYMKNQSATRLLQGLVSSRASILTLADIVRSEPPESPPRVERTS